MDIQINKNVSIPERELIFSTSRSSGPGGQHVNRVRTRITLWFDVGESSVLDDDQRRRIRARLATRVDARGRLRVICGRHRSQAANRREAVERFAALLADALKRRRRRKASGVPQAERRRRREEKQRRGAIKRLRRTAGSGEE